MNKEELGKLIAQLRSEKGLTVRKLAELSGVGAATISRLENGVYEPRLDTINSILAVLDAKLTIV